MASALVALVVALRVDFSWGAAFAAGSLAGLANWFLLAMILLAVLGRRQMAAFGCLTGKVFLLGAVLFGLLPAFRSQIGAFMCGFSMFLIVALLEALGALLISHLRKTPGARPLPRDWREMILGSAKDAH